MPRQTSRPSRLRRWRQGGRWAIQQFARVPRWVQIVSGVVILLAILVPANIVYQVIRKPTELFFFVGHRLDKEPAETWRQYGPLFRTYATGTITPELLAALAQIESSGNPLTRTYWRWQWSFNPFSIYKPASTAVGLFQTIDGAYTEARGSCVRDNVVVDSGCGFESLTFRVIPSHAIELTAVYLDRHVAATLARAGVVSASPAQKQDLAAFIHLCGSGPATAYARRRFHMIASERCGDHLVAAYVAKVDAMKREFLRLEGQSNRKDAATAD